MAPEGHLERDVVGELGVTGATDHAPAPSPSFSWSSSGPNFGTAMLIAEAYFFLGGSMYRPSVSTIFFRSSIGLIFPFAL
jgi:hypothetical protein